MLQTIDRALTLLVDMESENQMRFLQALSKAESEELESINTQCIAIMTTAEQAKLGGTVIKNVLQNAADDLSALQRKHASLIVKRPYFISAILHIIIMKSDRAQNNFDIVETLTLDGTASGLSKLSLDEVTMINPYRQPEAYLKNAIYESVDHTKFADKSCTIS